MIGKAVAKTERKVAYFAPTYQQARDIAWEALKKRSASLLAKPPNESRLELYVRTQDHGISSIWLRGWESIETARGQRFDFLVPDEVSSVRHFWEAWREILRPTLTDTRGEALFTSTPKGFNHFKELCEMEDKDKDFKSFHFTTYDNPIIPRDEIDKAKLELTEDAFWQEYMADFRKFTGLIYKEFERSIHVIDPIALSPRWHFYRALDFGATNPTVCLWIAVDPDYDTVYLFDEYYKSSALTETHASVVKGKTVHPIMVSWGDPSAKQQILDWGMYKIPITGALKDTGDRDWVMAGIKRVAAYIRPHPHTKKPRLYIFKNCLNTIREFESYHWMERKDRSVLDEDALKDVPDKVDDHCMDALRYFFISWSGIPEDSEPLQIHTNKFTGY